MINMMDLTPERTMELLREVVGGDTWGEALADAEEQYRALG